MWITLLAWTAPTAEAACDRGEITKVLEALTQVSSEQRSALAGVGLSEACTGPAGWVSGARDLAMVSPDMRSIIDAKVALETPGEWMAVCSGGLQPLIDMSAVAASEKRSLLWGACDLGRHGWMTEAQWSGADGAIVIALVGGHVLTESGVGADDVGTLVRALAGVGGDTSSSGQDAGMLGMMENDAFSPGDALFELQLDEGVGDLVGAPMIDESGLEPRGSGGAGMGSMGEGGGMLGSGQNDGPTGFGVLATDHGAGFAPTGRVEPTWSKAASRAGGSCTVQVFVTRQGKLKELKLLECDASLEDDVRAAVQASTFQARVKDGAAAAGRFRETYEVR